MSCFTRGLVLLGFGLCGGLAADLRADEAAGDLQPVLPTTHALFPNNPWQFRNISAGNGSIQLSADGKSLLSTSNGVGLWRMDNNQQMQMHQFNGPGVNLYNSAAALSPDGKTAALVPMYQNNDMAVRFFDVGTGRMVREIDNDEQITGLAFAPDGGRIAVCTRQRIELWDAKTGEELRVLSGGAMYRSMIFSPDGKMLAALSNNQPGTIHIWEMVSGKERGSIHFGPAPAPAPAGRVNARRAFMAAQIMGNNMGNNILALAFSRDSRLVAASTQDGGLHIWDLRTDRELPPLSGYRGNVLALTFSGDGRELLALDTEGTRLSWRVAALARNSHIKLAPLVDTDFADLWNDLSEPDLFRIYRARRHLTADATRAVPLLDRHLHPVPLGDRKRIEQLVADLSNANAGTRRKAMTELRTKHGEAALGALGGGGAAVNANGGPGMMPGRPMMVRGGGNNAVAVLTQKLQAKYNTPQRQRDLKAVAILEEIGTPEAKKVLTRLSKGAPGVSLTVEAKAALDRLAAVKKGKAVRASQPTLEQLWKDLGSDDAAKAFRAICALIATPRQAVELLQKQVKPAAVVEEKEIASLMERLSSDEFKVREQATKELSKLGELALPALKKAQTGKLELEAKRRIDRLVDQAASHATGPVLRSLRAVEVLEHTGTPEAKHVLVALAGGAPQASLTREAKASLERLVRK